MSTDQPQKKSIKRDGPSHLPDVPQEEGERVPALAREGEGASPEQPGAGNVEPPDESITRRPAKEPDFDAGTQ